MVALTLAGLALASSASAEGRAARTRATPREAHALVGAHVIVAPGEELADATILIRDGRIEAVGRDLEPPLDARRWDARGMTAWPAFLDAHVEQQRLEGGASSDDEEGTSDDATEQPAPASHPNPRVHPELRVLERLAPDEKAVRSLRAAGFGAVLAAPSSGVLRGRGALVLLGEGDVGELLLEEPPEVHAAFEAGGWGSDVYPSSVMGATAVIRQALLDASWHGRAKEWASRHRRAPRVVRDRSLEALEALLPGRAGRGGAGRLVFECGDALDALRAGQLADEAGVGLRLVGPADAWRRLEEITHLGVPVVAPLAFPEAPRAVGELEWLDVPLERLRHWHRAPDVPRWLHEAGLLVSLTTHGLEKPSELGDALRRCLERGLAEQAALAMLTTHPARMLGVEDRLGSLQPGRLANVVLAHGRPFEEGTEIREVWVEGRRHVVSRPPEGTEGRWAVEVRLPGGTAQGVSTIEGVLKVGQERGSFRFRPEGAEKRERAKLSALRHAHRSVSFTLEGRPLGLERDVALDCRLEDESLACKPAAGEPEVAIAGRRLLGPAPDRGREESRAPLPPPAPRGGPLGPGDDVLVTGATAWTCGPAGLLEEADVLVRDGRIAAVGRGLSAGGDVPVVDGSGLHVTPGLVDAHSHVAIVGGVNEATHSCTAEVRIGDVVDSEELTLYRQLAGGLTVANLLHGSANAMGGQSQVIKLRWGQPPEGLKFRAATPAIKFALGENVKQSNWGEEYTTRFPQTRMGVEQFMREKFFEALDYREDWRDWKAARRRAERLPPRRDLQMEALVEVLEGTRQVHCHSYRQDEILMLMRIAEELGFTVGTFQHVLEGYKVADEMAEHGAMASTFSDWWAYKFEVYDAIPYNGALMHDRGVVVSFNSDSGELGRRMSLEAAKAVKWGGVPPEEALKLVTLNPAKQLGVEDRVGSLEPGKDGDLVLWSGPPLSTSSLVLRTWVDGMAYFDREQDLERRAELERERLDLIEEVRRHRDDREEGEPATAGGDGPDEGSAEEGTDEPPRRDAGRLASTGGA